MPYARLNDLNMFYEEFGKGDALLFLHSHFSRGLLAFSAQIIPFQRHYHCFFPDFRGHGRSVCQSLDWDCRKIADDMAAFLDAMGIKRAHLVGYSCGSYVGCYMAAKYPEKVKSLVTIGGAAYPRTDDADNYLPESLIAANKTDTIEEVTTRHFEAHRGNWQTYLKTTVADWKAHPSLTDGEWAAIKCPALFINGELDPLGSCGELLEKVPHGEAYEVKGSGHRPHFVDEHAKELNQMILDFLSDVDKNQAD